MFHRQNEVRASFFIYSQVFALKREHCRYCIAEPSEYLVLTGAGIADIEICKKAWVWPWQRVQSTNMQFDQKVLTNCSAQGSQSCHSIFPSASKL